MAANLPPQPTIEGIPGLWRNKKTRSIYKATGYALHSETLEWHVEYQPHPFRRGIDFKWVHPLDLFVEKFTLIEAEILF